MLFCGTTMAVSASLSEKLVQIYRGIGLLLVVCVFRWFLSAGLRLVCLRLCLVAWLMGYLGQWKRSYWWNKTDIYISPRRTHRALFGDLGLLRLHPIKGSEWLQRTTVKFNVC